MYDPAAGCLKLVLFRSETCTPALIAPDATIQEITAFLETQPLGKYSQSQERTPLALDAAEIFAIRSRDRVFVDMHSHVIFVRRDDSRYRLPKPVPGTASFHVFFFSGAAGATMYFSPRPCVQTCCFLWDGVAPSPCQFAHTQGTFATIKPDLGNNKRVLKYRRWLLEDKFTRLCAAVPIFVFLSFSFFCVCFRHRVLITYLCALACGCIAGAHWKGRGSF